MSTFADVTAKTSICQRIGRLTPNALRQWGRMTPHQMICHLTDGYRLVVSGRKATRVDTFFSRSVMRWVALHTPVTWPKGIKTIPEVDQDLDGTKPAEWDRDHAELLLIIEQFEAIEGGRHPIFGPLTVVEWNVWAFRHADHHLRQFGV